jgi:hypothetical protein
MIKRSSLLRHIVNYPSKKGFMTFYDTWACSTKLFTGVISIARQFHPCLIFASKDGPCYSGVSYQGLAKSGWQ